MKFSLGEILVNWDFCFGTRIIFSVAHLILYDGKLYIFNIFFPGQIGIFWKSTDKENKDKYILFIF